MPPPANRAWRKTLSPESLHALSPRIRHKSDTEPANWADKDCYRPTLSAGILTLEPEEDRPKHLPMVAIVNSSGEQLFHRVATRAGWPS